MQTIPLALIALLVVTTPFVSADPALRPGKIPVFIAPGEVTINGEPRPDLGRSFSDTIAGGLLGSGSFTIIEPNIATADDAEAPSPEEIAAASSRGAHYAFIPRLIVEENYHRLTLKKVRVSDGEVVDIYERSAQDLERSAMFRLIDEAMKLVYNDLSDDRSRQEEADRAAVIDLDPDPQPSGTVIVVPPEPTITYPPSGDTPKTKPKPRITEPASNTGTNTVAVIAPSPKKKDKPAPKTKPKPSITPPAPDISRAKEATAPGSEYAGRLRAVNTEWHFCIIEVAERGVLQVDDELLVRGSTSPEPLGKLRVSKVEGSQVVADSVDIPLEKLRAGFKVYR